MDDLAAELHREVDDYRDRQEAVGWPSPLERAIFVSVDAALVLLLAHFEAIDAEHPEGTVH